ncbi:hypothetical protein EDD22DRAFT_852872 [Suillus occidentalis]|nr:hypothetical protein EDD22DRAFT_852872 [Suillus occidentalis]
MLIPAAGASIEDLTTALFEFTLNTPGVTLLQRDMLRAIAILLGQADHESKAKTIAETVGFHMIGTIERFEKAIDPITALSPQIALIITASETLKANAESFTQLRNTMAEADATQPSPDQTNKARSYSSIVQQNSPIPIPVSAALTRAAIKERQILFEPTIGETLYEPKDNSFDIAKRFKKAFDIVQIDDSPDLQIKAITRLRNGSLIIELTTTEAANWIRQIANRTKIINALDLPATIKERRFSVIVPFLSVSSNIDNADWLRAVEKENEMPTGSIETANWIKPKNRRSSDQRVAHAIFHFTGPTAANNTLRDGIYIGQEKLHPRKDKREPVRCSQMPTLRVM